jgi:hypothetical protein
MQTELPELQNYAQEKRSSCVAWYFKGEGRKKKFCLNSAKAEQGF